MPAEIPYSDSTRNLVPIFEKIKAAGTPPKFTHEFLTSNLGFRGSRDRAVIQILKALGFLTPDGVPTGRYNEFRDTNKSGAAMAAGLRDGWSDLFLSDQRAQDRTVTELTGIFKSITGKGESSAEKMASTFKALGGMADWKAPTFGPPEFAPPTKPEPDESEKVKQERLSVSLHSDVHIHLPTSLDVAVYTAIFRALREELLD